MASSHKSAQRSKLGEFKELANGTIRVRVRHGYRLDGNQRVLIGHAKDMREAERLAISLSSDLGRTPELGRGVTLKTWWDAYSAGKGSRIAKATFKQYKDEMENVWLPKFGSCDISLINRKDVQTTLLKLRTRQKAERAKKSLSAVLTQAVREGYLETNPIRSGGFEMPERVGTLSNIDTTIDPFAAIEARQDVWSAQTVLDAMPRLQGVPLETCWLAMVGAGLRREEALALVWGDVRRVNVGGKEVTQIAVYKAYTKLDGMKVTKTPQSVRIVAMVEPFGSRLWELRGDPMSAVCEVSIGNINARWRNLFEPITSKHSPTKGRHKGKLAGFPYVPIGRMRATHETYMQQAGVLDSVNAAAHGHSQRVSYTNYQRPDVTGAALRAGEWLSNELDEIGC